MPIPAAFDLSGRVAVVTGAGSPDGIGSILESLPLHAWMTATTTELSPHPSDPAILEDIN